ncbi:MAG: response regulator [Anaerolineales bacterium]
MKPNILCIEDHPDNMTLIKRIFRPEFYNVLEANCGLDGVSLAEKHDIDLVLLDINLPDIDGYEVAHRLRTSSKTSLTQVPIIAVTANAMRGDDKKILAAGCTKYISKPINIQELMDTVDSLLPKE